MSGGALTKEAKEMFLKEDIEHKRQRTLDNKNFIPKEICKCGHSKRSHISEKDIKDGIKALKLLECGIIDCKCKKYKEIGGIE